MTSTTHKYQAISTDDDDRRPAPSVIELTTGKPSADDYRSINDYKSAFSYSRQINLHTLTGTNVRMMTLNLFIGIFRKTSANWN